MKEFNILKFIDSCIMSFGVILLGICVIGVISFPFVVVYRNTGLHGLYIALGIAGGCLTLAGIINFVKWKLTGHYLSDE